MRSRAHHGPDAGWRSVFDRELWRQGIAIGTLGAVSMALFACAVALARDTIGHDWYAAAKLTVAELMIGAGFDGNEPIEFRNEDGVVETVARSGLTAQTGRQKPAKFGVIRQTASHRRSIYQEYLIRRYS